MSDTKGIPTAQELEEWIEFGGAEQLHRIFRAYRRLLVVAEKARPVVGRNVGCYRILHFTHLYALPMLGELEDALKALDAPVEGKES